MKKILLCLLFIFCLVGCNGKTTTTTADTTTVAPNKSFKVISPNGSPALAQTYMQSTKPSLGNNVSYDIEIVSDATQLAAAMTSQSHEVVYAPINLGTKMYNATGNYLLAATVVFGNNYIVTATDEEFTLESLNGKDIVLFGQNNVPAIVTLEILNANNIVPNSITYLPATSDTKNELVTDPSKIVLLAEPSFSATKTALNNNGITNVKAINLQDEWKKITEDESYPQAGIFVNKTFANANPEIVKAYIAEVEKSINYANANVDVVAQMAVDLEYGFPLPVLKSAIPNSNLLFKKATDAKTLVEDLLQKIIDSGNGALIGGKLPDEGFYFA